MTDGNVEGLRASVTAAQAEIGRIQSALSVVNDRVDGTLALIGRLSEGSNNTNLENAASALGSIALTVDELIGKSAEAVDLLEAYAAQR